jgi:hypothetical protein
VQVPMTAPFAMQVHWPPAVQTSLKTIGVGDIDPSTVQPSKQPQHPHDGFG